MGMCNHGVPLDNICDACELGLGVVEADSPTPSAGSTLLAGYLVECKPTGAMDFFAKREYAEVRKSELESAGWPDIEITPLYRAKAS